MTGALRIATLFRIPVRIHWSFLLIFVYVLYTGYAQGWDTNNIIWSLIFVVALFGCVVLHEFGHALTARCYGVETRDIILSPIGGVARLDRLPEQPLQEFLVAVAGPLVNTAIALTLSPYLLTLSPQSRTQLFQVILQPESNYFPTGLSQLDYFLAGLILLNLTLALFNMIPAFPMDGGRVLRALLSIRLQRHQATRIAAYIGQGLALLFLGYGILFEQNIFYFFIGLFVFFAASGEYRMVRTQYLMRQYRVSDVARQQFVPLQSGDTMGQAIEKLPGAGQQSFLVLNAQQQVIGVLTEKHIKEAHQARDYDTPVDQYLIPSTGAVRMDQTLEEAYQSLENADAKTLPVYSDWGAVIGMLDLPALERFLRFARKG